MLFHPSHPGEVLKDYLGDMTVKEAARRLGVTRPNLSRILNGRAGHFSGNERAACQGDAVHVSRVLAEDAAQLRSLEASEKQAA
jgi:transcriptional regulator with XRE-family HTH domain